MKRTYFQMQQRAAADADERERRREKVPRHTTLAFPAGPGGDLRGGALLPYPQIADLRLIQGLGLPNPWDPEADIFYVNVFVPGAALAPDGSSARFSTSSTPAQAVRASFNRSFDKLLVIKPSDYRMAVVRATLPLSNVPLFYYPLGSCSLTVGFLTKKSGASPNALYAWTSASRAVTPDSLDPASDLIAGQNPSYPAGAVAVWNVQQFLDALNNCATQLVAQLQAGTYAGAASAGQAPFFAHNAGTDLLSISFEQQAWYGGPDPQRFPDPAASPATNPAPAPAARNWPLRYPVAGMPYPTSATVPATASTMFLFMNTPLHETYFGTMPAQYTSEWQYNLDGSLSTLAADQLPAAAQVCVLLGPYYDPNPNPVTGPEMSLRVSTAPNERVDITGGVFTWRNPRTPHGVRPGDVVIVSGADANPTLNGVYQVSLTGNNGGAGVAITTHASPQAMDFTWQANTAKADVAPVRQTDEKDLTMTASTGSQLPGQWSTVFSSVATMSLWNGIAAVRVLSDSIPSQYEFVPGQNPAGAPSALSIRRIILDVKPNATLGGELTRDVGVYQPQDFRWFNLLGDDPLHHWSVFAVWVDVYGNEWPMYVNPGEVFELKSVLRRKDRPWH